MNNEVVNKLIKVNHNLIIPEYIIQFYNDIELEGLNLLFIIYLINQKENILLDINKISNDLNQSSSVVLDLINDLNEKNYISIEMKKNNGIIEEYISIDLFYNKINSLIISKKEKENKNNIYSVFEQEFGRTLSPTEYETISNWLSNNVNEDMIMAALKEAVLSGVSNLRYIDKILFEWNKKGYNNVNDIKKKQIKDDDYLEEIYDYDWINEE